jgi:GxxExxY protein
MSYHGGHRGLGVDTTERIIGAAIEVHRQLAPELLESSYEACLCHELTLRDVRFERPKPVKLMYQGVEMPCR